MAGSHSMTRQQTCSSSNLVSSRHSRAATLHSGLNRLWPASSSARLDHGTAAAVAATTGAGVSQEPLPRSSNKARRGQHRSSNQTHGSNNSSSSGSSNPGQGSSPCACQVLPGRSPPRVPARQGHTHQQEQLVQAQDPGQLQQVPGQYLWMSRTLGTVAVRMMMVACALSPMLTQQHSGLSSVAGSPAAAVGQV